MLGDTEVFCGNEAKLPGLGISSGRSVLVYQRDHLPWPDPGNLAKKDGNLSAMRSIQTLVSSFERGARRIGFKESLGNKGARLEGLEPPTRRLEGGWFTSLIAVG